MPMVLDLLTIFEDVQAAQLVASWLAASWLLGCELDDGEMTVNLLLFKQVTKAVHLCVVSGSLVRVYQPWTVNEYGYTTSVVAKLFQVEATTSLAYRQLIEADAIDVRGYNM